MRRRCVGLAHITLDRAQRTSVAVLTHQPGMQCCQVHGQVTPLAEPVVDRLVHRRSASPLPCAAIEGPTRQTAQVIPHGSFGNGKLAIRLLTQPKGA